MAWWIVVLFVNAGAYSWNFVVNRLSGRRVLELLGFPRRDSPSAVSERPGRNDDASSL
ncbi:MAG TPA: hypothetical protein VGZ27_05025 [Vicinamibacterales bacterium]|jgi:hypothetical protein|nr:hypothetical protein [Vicinamibacterales bacterium]